MKKLLTLLFRKQPKRDIWTETMIRLYERQVEAREALGLKWRCHPLNNVERLDKPSKKVVYIRNFNTDWPRL